MKGREIFIELDYKYKVSAQHNNTIGLDSFSYLQRSRVVLTPSFRKLAIQSKVTNNIVWSRTKRLNELVGTIQHSLE